MQVSGSLIARGNQLRADRISAMANSENVCSRRTFLGTGLSTTGRTVIQAEVYAYHSANIANHPELYLPETLDKLRLGAGIDLATYIQARLKLDQLRRTAAKTFGQVDILATPTTPIPPPKASELPSRFDDIMSNDALMWRNTRPFNLSGIPNLHSVRLHESRVADRFAAQRSSMGRRLGTSVSAHLRASDELIYAPSRGGNA
jgi:Asp-tRNA(Asn)/Glu-tRNA(Gln) amidotransferase A subunit family amidase